MNRELLERPFSGEDVKTRRGRNGQNLSYVEIQNYIRRLNEALEGDWSFEVVEHKVLDDEVLVLGRLTAGDVVKTDFGGSAITRGRADGEVVCLADDLKAAASDYQQGCARLLGVGLDLYREEVEETAPVRHDLREGNGRLSRAQHDKILELAGERDIGHGELQAEVKKRFGRKVEFLSKADASSLIDALIRGRARAKGNGNGDGRAWR